MNSCIRLVLLSILVAACDSQSGPVNDSSKLNSIQDVTEELNKIVRIETVPERGGDFAGISRGAKLFNENCTQCHREGAVGALNWHKRGTSGNFPPPPLNGSGHAWHHPKTLLIEMVQNGGQVMPPFGTVLSVSEITDIIHWFQSLWPDELYAAWTRNNESYGQSQN